MLFQNFYSEVCYLLIFKRIQKRKQKLTVLQSNYDNNM